jgi:hypothetical protein
MPHNARQIGLGSVGRSPLNSALISQVLLAVYLQVVEWIPLGRWNNFANGNGQESMDIILALL